MNEEVQSSEKFDSQENENQFDDEETINLLKPENKLNDKQLEDLIKAIYEESEVCEDEDKRELVLTSYDVHEKRSPLDEEEIELGNQLKKRCYETGKETNLTESSAIFHQLALNYSKRSSDKINLIKSAALFNAALIRSPENKIIEQDLRQLCRYILKLANAKKTEADLIDKGKIIKQKAISMRSKVKKRLKLVDQVAYQIMDESLLKDQEKKKIKDIISIQDEISMDYLHLMEEIAIYCNQVMGDAPCKFSIAGMGSLARKEITPYSDFEHIILLEKIDDQDSAYESKLDYFRWYSVIFHVIVINLQETILPSVDIACLRKSSSNRSYWFYDQVTPRGISFDGLLPWASKMPLGRQEFTKNKPFKTELIKPVSKMLQYLSSEESLKQGYNLADILTKVCYVYGDEVLFRRFQSEMYALLEAKDSDAVMNELVQQLKEDLQNFAVRSAMLQLRSSNSFNIKRVIYRSTTLFIAALGRFYNIHANSSFEIIEKLSQRELISQNAQHKLEFAISLACEMRLRWYMQNEKQNDEIQTYSDEQSTIELFTSLVGKVSTISYFQIAYSLQCDIAKRFNLKKSHFHSHPQLFNHKLLFCLNCEDEASITDSSQTQTDYNQRYLSFDECLSFTEKNTKTKNTKQVRNNSDYNSKLQAIKSYMKIGDKCKDHSIWDDAHEFFEMCIYIIKELGNIKQSIQLHEMHSDCLCEVGYCLYRSYKEDDAINRYKQSILICKSLPQNSKCFRMIANRLYRIEMCLNDTQKFREAIKYYKQSLQIFQSISKDIDADEDISYVLGSMAECYVNMNEKDEGEKYLRRSMLIQIRIESNKSKKDDDYFSSYKIGRRLCRSGKPVQALVYLEKSLNIKQQKLINDETDSDIALILHYTGRCLYDLNKPDEAIECFQKSLKIKEESSINQETDPNIADTLYYIGQCLYDLNKLDEALECFQKCLNIEEKTSINYKTDSNIAFILYYIGRCLYDFNKPSEALEYFQKALKIEEETSIDKKTDSGVSRTINGIGDCLIQLNRNDEAEYFYERANQIKQNSQRF